MAKKKSEPEISKFPLEQDQLDEIESMFADMRIEDVRKIQKMAGNRVGQLMQTTKITATAEINIRMEFDANLADKDPMNKDWVQGLLLMQLRQQIDAGTDTSVSFYNVKFNRVSPAGIEEFDDFSLVPFHLP